MVLRGPLSEAAGLLRLANIDGRELLTSIRIACEPNGDSKLVLFLSTHVLI
jgi:hypothetical protein